ncbi:MAG TPA: ABC transporter permease [Terracidiphilus sp.]|jgi:predicted permease
MAGFGDSFKQVFRRLVRAPLFTAITLITLAVGIGANTVVFSVVEGVLLKPLSYPHAEQLVGVWYHLEGIPIDKLPMAPFLYFIEREQGNTFQDIGVYSYDGLNVTGVGEPEHVLGFDVTDGTLPLLGARPVLGRLFTKRDDTAGAPQTVVLSYGYWRKKFGASPSVIGRSITIDGKTREIIGVLPKDFHFLDSEDAALYVPLQWDRSKTKLGNFSYQGIARLKPGVTLAQVKADMTRLLPVAVRSFPAPDGFPLSLFEKIQMQPVPRPLKQDVIGDVGNVLWVLMGSIGVVLLVACANVANLLLVRVEGRRQEMAIRTALGASRWRVMAGLLYESLILGFAGSVIGLAIAYGGLRALIALKPTGLPRLNEIGIDGPVLLFTLGLALFVSVVIGLIPVIKYAGVALHKELREGGRALSQGREKHRARKSLVVVQVALALVLLICSGLMIHTFRALMHVSPGFADPQSVQTFHLYIPESRVSDNQRIQVVRREQAIADKLASIPGVSAVSFGTNIPFQGYGSNDPVFIKDRVYRPGELPPIRRFKFIAPGFLGTMGTPMVAGRDITWTDTYEKRPVALVSENLAKEFWQSPAAALGHQIRVGNIDDWREVIGVVRDMHDDGVNNPAPPSVYWPVFRDRFEGQPEQVERNVGFVIRSRRAGSASFMSEVQRAVWSVDSDLALADASTLGALYTKSLARTSFTLVMLCVAGSMALLLGIVGIYGVISYAVAQRTREIGIRMALGAERQVLTGMFVRQGLWLTGIGVAIGLVMAFLSVRLITALLFSVSPLDPWSYSIATLCVTGIAWIACYLPSRRAAVVNPVDALRSE